MTNSKRHTKQILTRGCEAPELLDAIRSFEGGLKAIGDRLAVSAGYSIENLEKYSQTPWLPRYIMAHTSWHQSNIDNYRVLLSGYREAVPPSIIIQVDPDYVAYARRQCYDHAHSMVEIFANLLDLKTELPIMDTDIAMCAWHAVRVILYFHRNSEVTSSEATETVLNQVRPCLDIVKRLFKASPMAAILVSLYLS